MEIPVGRTNVPVAVVGMACRLPGANNLEQFWQLLSSGGSAVVELPHERLDQELYYHPEKGQRGKSYAKLGAIIASRQFDRNECPIPGSLERGVDNAHLLMCQTAAAALRQAGLNPFGLPLRNTGVYIGHAQGSDLAGEYTLGTSIEEAAQFLREVPGFAQLSPVDQEAVIQELISGVRAEMPRRAADSPDVAINMVAGTISKAFGLSGPYIAVNSACASSLQSVMYGVRALQLGRIDMAIVGGASDCKSDSLVLFSHAQSMSETGSRPFDAGADGLICSEGYVCLVLKTLDRALADGDPIQAVIRGLGASCDGKGKSLWAPRKEGQVKAMARAYRNGLEMSSLQYIEAHATSTNLGDATELNALAEVLADKFPPGKKIPITSVKANIGHALESAGVSSVIKTILCLQHRTFVPAINIQSLNPKINWDAVPFYIQRQLAPWPEQQNGLPRRAAVNAFGIGGLNVHIVLEEFTPAQRAAALQTKQPAGAPLSPDEEAVAVIGMGCILPGASEVAKYWEQLTSGRDPKCQAPADRLPPSLVHPPGPYQAYRTPTTLGGFITDFAYDWRKHKVPPRQVQEADPLQFMLLEAAEQAIRDAGYDQKPFDRERVAVLVGTEFGSDFSIQLEVGLKLPRLEKTLRGLLARRGIAGAAAQQIGAQFSDVVLKHWPALVDESGSFSTSTLASRITKTMNLMGGAASIDAGNSSAAAALASSVDALVSGDCDMMICAAGQRCLSLAAYEGMASVGILSTAAQPVSPFDAQASGIVPGEGVGVVLLKRLADARRDGDRIHAIIRGIGAAHSEAGAESQRQAIQRALSIAQIGPSDVGLLEIDGTGVVATDQEQLGAVLAEYATSPRSEPLLLGSVTSQIGHTVGASAMASFIKASLEVEHGEMPAAFGIKQPTPVVAAQQQVVRVPAQREPLRHATHDGRRYAAVCSYGKGLAYHIVLERGERVPVTTPARAPSVPQQQSDAAQVPVKESAVSAASATSSWQIFRCGAGSPTELATALQRALANPAAAFAACSTTHFGARDAVRLAIVAANAESLAQKLHTVATQLGNPAAWPVLEQQGCFYRQVGTQRPRVALLFPGQGSQYAGMLRELVRDVPAAAARLRELDAVMQRHGFQTFAQMAWDQPQQLGSDIWVTQVVMLLADTIVQAALGDFGVQADLVAGHSYGEYAALTAAGVWDLEGAITAARARYDGIEATPTARGAMLATAAPAPLVEQLTATLGAPAYAANYNAPDQTVVGGTPAALQALANLLNSHGHKSQLLPVPCPFHTPLMQGAGDHLKRTLDTLPLDPPRIPTLSTVTNRFVAEPDEIRANLAAQLTTPVRWVDLIHRLAGERPTVFIEVGPQQALTKLNRRILADRNVAGIIGTDNPKRPGVEQLYYVQALLECCGAVGALAAARPAAAVPTGTPTTATRATVAATSGTAPRGAISHFDATERRRERMRKAAAKEAPAAAMGNGSSTTPVHNGTNGASTYPHTPAPGSHANGNGNGNGHAVAPPRQPAPATSGHAAADVLTKALHAASAPPAPVKQSPVTPVAAAPVTVTPMPAPQAAPAAPAAAQTKPGAPAPADLEKFLINFVVEQTGYPPEVVEIDADLEADLGIDSIKKAQLFGELAEYFDVQPTEGMTLDDFPTLRHVLNFLQGAQTTAPIAAAPAPSAPAAAPAAAPTFASTVPPATTAPQYVVPPAANVAQTTTAAAAAPATADLEKFLINFVVEQTGYPPEVVELDADLEADLGIDSIKKAQLFGELAEYFDVQPTEGMTLDDFPTLRHVLNFLQGAPMKGSPPPGTPDAAAVIANPVAAAPASAQPAPPTYTPSQPVAAAPAANISAPIAGGELEKFLINFVVEQTGYPPEVVELDADLEADLGIDSIKKAQLFGELAEYFDVQPTEGMTLDDFPTLRHVLNFLQGAPMKAGAPVAADDEFSSAASAAAPYVAPLAATPSPAPVAYPPSAPVVSASTFASSAAHVDAPSFAPAMSAQATGAAVMPASTDPAELEQFLINFVVEQTGYPPEVVELDADLEADLGIDSIKKAQLFGELAEYFDVQPTEGMTLDDFPTLRHVLNFLVGADLKKNLTPNQIDAGPAENPPHHPPIAPPDAALASAVPTPAITAPEIAVLRLAGTPYQIGYEHGRQRRDDIRRVLRRFADIADGVPAYDELIKAFTADELDELRGVANAVGVGVANLIALNVAQFADFGTGAWQLAISSEANHQAGLFHASQAAAPLSGALASLCRPVVQWRTPTRGIAHVLVSFAGAAGGLCGTNAHGLTVTARAPQRGSATSRAHAAIAPLLLAGASDIDAALVILSRGVPAGDWDAFLSHSGTERICSIACRDGQLAIQDRLATATTQGQLSATSGQHSKFESLLAEMATQGLTASALFSRWWNALPNNANPVGNSGAHAKMGNVTVVIDPTRRELWIDASDSSIAATAVRGRLSLAELRATAAPAPAIPPAAPYDLAELPGEATHRFVLEMFETAFDADVPAMPVWHGAALVVGDNPAAAALVAHLQNAGVTVRTMSLGEDVAATLAEFERIWNEQPTPHLFIMTPRDRVRGEPTDQAAWDRRWQHVAVQPYFLIQRWIQLAGQAKLLDKLSVIAATNMGGHLGFDTQVVAPECGALTGLLKAILIEFRIMRGLTTMYAKAIDSPDNEPPADLAANICRELASKSVDFEVSFTAGKRRLPFAFPHQAPTEQLADVRPGGTWVVTGGARGITAACALELGRRFGLKLHLIGTSPLRPIDPAWRGLSAEELKGLRTTVMRDAAQARKPLEETWNRVRKDIEIDESLQTFAAAGVSVTYHACDVADSEALAQVLTAIRASSGPIDGIVHGAGIERSSAFERKKPEVVDVTLAAKVTGCANLMRLTWEDPVRHFIGFGSISGRLGSNGQTDYSLASDALCKLAGWYRSRRPGVRAVGFHWHPWADIGMAAVEETATMLRRNGGPAQMPKAEGVRHFVRELYATASDSEVLITDWEYYARYYGTDHVPPGALPNGPDANATDSGPKTDIAKVREALGEAKPAQVRTDERPSGATSAQPWDAPPAERFASRQELTMVDAPLPNVGMIGLAGTACIVGANPAALALRDRLQAAGMAVYMLPVTTSPEEAMAAIEAVYQQTRPTHLFLMSGRDPATNVLDHREWQQRRALGVAVPFLTAQHWFRLRMKAKDTSPITVVAATSLGGDFGLAGRIAQADGGALTGLIKSLYVEDTRRPQREVRAKVIDAPADEPPTALAEAICRELSVDAPDVEVAWSHGQRRIVQSVVRPVESLPRLGLQQGGVFVATGGARGITAAVVFELAKRYGGRWHLVGRSPAPAADVPWRNCSADQLAEIKSQVVRRAVAEGRSPERDWERVKTDMEIIATLDKFAAAGISATYHGCDVADWDQLGNVLETIRKADGPITGVLHGAGFADSGRFGTRSREKFERTIAGKLDGAAGLMALTQADPLRFLIGFGSISGRYGGNGLADYAAANDMLAKLFNQHRAQRPSCATCTFHWQSWDEIGMAMLGDSNVGTKGVLKMRFLSPKEGIDHLCRELEAGLPSAEVLISDGFFAETFYPFSAATVPASGEATTSSSSASIDRLPLVDAIKPAGDGAGIEAAIRFQPTVDPFLIDHQLRGKPLLPAVVALEALTEAALLAASGEVAAIRDVKMIDGLAFFSDRPVDARVQAVPQADGTVQCSLIADFHNRAGKLMHAARLYQQATLLLTDRAAPLQMAMPQPPTEWIPFVFPEGMPIYHGPTLQGLRATAFDEQGGWAQVAALPLAAFGGARTGRDWFVPAPLLDAAFYVCGTHAFICGDGVVSLPQAIEQVRRGRMPSDNELCLMQFRCRVLEKQFAIYDFTVFGANGDPILAVDGHRIVMLRKS